MLTHEAKIKNILMTLGGIIILITISAHLITYLTPQSTDEGLPSFNQIPDGVIFYKLLMGCLIAPVVEESLFRYLPLQLIRHRPDYKKLEIPVVVGVSIIFGWMHGDEVNVFIQGIIGLCLFWVYIKNGYSLMSSIIVHCLYNFYVLTGLIHFT